jgi:hypothetical protein
MKTVAVTWIDAQSRDDIDLSEAEKLCPALATSYGLLICKDEEKLNIASTRFRSGEFRQVLTIPIGNVKEIKELGDED